MAPVTQYVFAEMLRISEYSTAGSHEWLPYSDFPTFSKQTAKHQFADLLTQVGMHIAFYCGTFFGDSTGNVQGFSLFVND